MTKRSENAGTSLAAAFAIALALLLGACAALPFGRSGETPPPESPEMETAEPAGLDPEREAALRALPERTVILEDPPPGMLQRWWQRVFPPRNPEAPAAVAPLWIGSIKVVHPSDGYVLIDSNVSMAIPPGEVLNSVGNDFETGTVRVTADRIHPFFIADIVSGNPRVGDRVYSPQ